MTQPDLHLPVTELGSQQPPQQFTGHLNSLTKREGDPTTTLTAVLNRGDQILIAGDTSDGMHGNLLGAPISAQVELGAQDDGAEDLLIVKVDGDPGNIPWPMRALLGKTGMLEQSYYGAERPGPSYVLVMGDKRTPVKAFTVVDPHTHFGVIGRRQNNMQWFNAFGEPLSEEKAVTNNTNVDEAQLIVSNMGEAGLLITKESSDTPTTVYTMPTEDHRSILEAGQAASAAAAESGRTRRVGAATMLGGLAHRRLPGRHRRETPQAADLRSPGRLRHARTGQLTYPDRPSINTVSLEGDEEGAQHALDYVRKLFPKEEFSLLSLAGSGAIVLEGKNSSKVFKVLKSPGRYSYTESEAGALQFMGEAGLTPKLTMLVDAAQEYRSELSMYGGSFRPRREFENVIIPRVNGGGEYPVIVMDKVNARPLRAMPEDVLLQQFDEILAFALENKLEFGDVEPVYDADAGGIKIIDVGGIARVQLNRYMQTYDGRQKDLYPGMPDNVLERATIIGSVLNSFIDMDGRLISIQEVAKIMTSGDLDGFHQLLKRARRTGTLIGL